MSRDKTVLTRIGIFLISITVLNLGEALVYNNLLKYPFKRIKHKDGGIIRHCFIYKFASAEKPQPKLVAFTGKVCNRTLVGNIFSLYQLYDNIVYRSIGYPFNYRRYRFKFYKNNFRVESIIPRISSPGEIYNISSNDKLNIEKKYNGSKSKTHNIYIIDYAAAILHGWSRKRITSAQQNKLEKTVKLTHISDEFHNVMYTSNFWSYHFESCNLYKQQGLNKQRKVILLRGVKSNCYLIGLQAWKEVI